MTLRGRLRRLERQVLLPGVCPGCGFGPEDIRTILVVHPFGSCSPLPPPDPPRERCRLCGGGMPPIRRVEVVAQAPRQPGATLYEIVKGTDGQP
jgi:hypothetical protein